ncbi:uncharacterized protein LOC143222414 [Tachypleus tridentatus]|uniref:uncharacterized protein LOC143222414 n=1 Tax=Tachypleus tridentatus TaxID=6853 RepID=UPI003FD4F1D0
MSQKRCLCFQPALFIVISLTCLGMLSLNYWDLYVSYKDVFQQLREVREQERVANQKRAESETYADKTKIDLYNLREEFDKIKFEFSRKDKILQDKDKELMKKTEEAENLTNRMVELNKTSSELQTCEEELQSCLKDSKGKEESNRNLEAEIFVLKDDNNQLKETLDKLRKRIPEGVLEGNQITQEVQQMRIAKGQKENQFEMNKDETEEELTNTNNDGVVNAETAEESKHSLKRKLLSLDKSGYYNQWEPTHKNSNTYNEKLGSSLHNYEQPLEEIIGYTTDNEDNSQNVENSPDISPYRPSVKVPPIQTVFFSGNMLDPKKTGISNGNAPISQQQGVQARDEDPQLSPGMSLQSDYYRLSEQRPYYIIYSKENKPKLVELPNTSEGSHNEINADESQRTNFISSQNNRAMINDIREGLDKYYHLVDWKENAQKLAVDKSDEQDENERLARPWETRDKPETDLNWKQSDNTLQIQLRAKNSPSENEMTFQSEVGHKSSDKPNDAAPTQTFNIDDKNQNLIHGKRERELAFLDNISNILNKVKIQLDDMQLHVLRSSDNNKRYPIGTQAERHHATKQIYNNRYTVDAQEQNNRPLIQNYYNRNSAETHPQTYHEIEKVQSYENYRNVRNELESDLDRNMKDFQSKRSAWSELLHRSLIPEVEKNENSESVVSSEENQYSRNILPNNFFNPKNVLDLELQNEVQEKSQLSNQTLYETFKISDIPNTLRANGSDVIQLKMIQQRFDVPGDIFDTREVNERKLETDEEKEDIEGKKYFYLPDWKSSSDYNKEKSFKQQTNNDETNWNLLWNTEDDTRDNHQRQRESWNNRDKSNKERQRYELISNGKTVEDDTDEIYSAPSYYYYDEEDIEMNQNYNSDTDTKLIKNDDSYREESE